VRPVEERLRQEEDMMVVYSDALERVADPLYRPFPTEKFVAISLGKGPFPATSLPPMSMSLPAIQEGRSSSRSTSSSSASRAEASPPAAGAKRASVQRRVSQESDQQQTVVIHKPPRTQTRLKWNQLFTFYDQHMSHAVDEDLQKAAAPFHTDANTVISAEFAERSRHVKGQRRREPEDAETPAASDERCVVTVRPVRPKKRRLPSPLDIARHEHEVMKARQARFRDQSILPLERRMDGGWHTQSVVELPSYFPPGRVVDGRDGLDREWRTHYLTETARLHEDVLHTSNPQLFQLRAQEHLPPINKTLAVSQ